MKNLFTNNTVIAKNVKDFRNFEINKDQLNSLKGGSVIEDAIEWLTDNG